MMALVSWPELQMSDQGATLRLTMRRAASAPGHVRHGAAPTTRVPLPAVVPARAAVGRTAQEDVVGVSIGERRVGLLVIGGEADGRDEGGAVKTERNETEHE